MTTRLLTAIERIVSGEPEMTTLEIHGELRADGWDVTFIEVGLACGALARARRIYPEHTRWLAVRYGQEWASYL